MRRAAQAAPGHAMARSTSPSSGQGANRALVGLKGVIMETRPRSQGSFVLAVVFTLLFLLQMQKPFFLLFFPLLLPRILKTKPAVSVGAMAAVHPLTPSPVASTASEPERTWPAKACEGIKLAAAPTTAYGPDNTNTSSYSDASSLTKGGGQ